MNFANKEGLKFWYFSRAIGVEKCGKVYPCEITLDRLLQPASVDSPSRPEGVSTGTRYALSKWLASENSQTIDVSLVTIV